MTRLTFGLISLAALLATSPAFAGGQHGADVARPVFYEAPINILATRRASWRTESTS